MKKLPILFVLVLLAVTIVPGAMANYNPQTGRFLQRDPVGYVDGMNLYQYVGGTPTMFVDPSGTDYHESIRSASLADIRRTYNNQIDAYTGDANSVGQAVPHPLADSIDLVSFQNNCCAEAIKAQRIDVNVLTVLPNDVIGSRYTSNGFSVAQGHEGRRREIHRKAYNKYIGPVQGVGSLVTKCGKICRPGSALLLIGYLEKIRAAGIAAYNTWVLQQQRALGRLENQNDWGRVDGMRDSLIQTYTVPDPPPLTVIPCPLGN